jgi:hypothetical protein
MTEQAKAIVSAGPGGFSLSRAAVDELNQRRPHLFEGPFDKWGFQLDDDETEESLLRRFWFAVFRKGKMYFLAPEDRRLRTDPVLVSRLEIEGDAALRGDASGKLNLVTLPKGVGWYVFVHEDGSEAIWGREHQGMAAAGVNEMSQNQASTQLSFRDVLHTRAWLGDRDLMFELAKKLGYPYFLWNDQVHAVEDSTTYSLTALTADDVV